MGRRAPDRWAGRVIVTLQIVGVVAVCGAIAYIIIVLWRAIVGGG